MIYLCNPKLKEKYKNTNITFIDVSIDSLVEEWQTFLSDNNLEGIQLYAGDDASFKNMFKANNVPQFLLISPEGKISTAVAPRPSETDCIELLFNRIAENPKISE